MRHVEFTRATALLSPGLDELAILRELHDARIDVSIGYEDVAVWRHGNVGGTVEHIRLFAGLAGRTDRHQQLAVARVLENLLALAVLPACVGEPEEAVAVDANPVRVDEPAAPRLQHFARRIELDDVRFVAVEGQNAPFFVDCHRGHFAPRDAARQRTPSVDQFVGLILSARRRL